MNRSPIPIAVVDDARFDAHRARGYHPERPERLEAARSGLQRAVSAEQRIAVDARPATRDELQRVHAERYVTALDRTLREHSAGQFDPDTYFGPGTREAAWAAAGGAVDLANALMTGRAKRGLGLLRPPGHHARPHKPMGFCILNNIAIAAAATLDRAERVAIVDWDVHHGNGTQDRFYGDGEVLLISIHQATAFPGTGRPDEVGAGEGAGRNVNVALPVGAGSEIYGVIFRRLVLPLLDAFGADVTLVSCGFDGHRRDPLASLELDTELYAAMATAVVRQAEQAGHGRVAAFLEGGYDLVAIEESTAAVVRALGGETTELPADRPRAAELEALDATLRAVGPHWSGIGGGDLLRPA